MSDVGAKLRAKAAAVVGQDGLGVPATIEVTTGRTLNASAGTVSAGSTASYSVNVAPLAGAGERYGANGERIRSQPTTTLAASLLSFTPTLDDGATLDVVIGTARYRAVDIQEVRVGTSLVAYTLTLDRV